MERAFLKSEEVRVFTMDNSMGHVGHAIFTSVGVCLNNFNTVVATMLFIGQGIVLFPKVRKQLLIWRLQYGKRKRKKGDREEYKEKGNKEEDKEEYK